MKTTFFILAIFALAFAYSAPTSDEGFVNWLRLFSIQNDHGTSQQDVIRLLPLLYDLADKASHQGRERSRHQSDFSKDVVVKDFLTREEVKVFVCHACKLL